MGRWRVCAAALGLVLGCSTGTVPPVATDAGKDPGGQPDVATDRSSPGDRASGDQVLDLGRPELAVDADAPDGPSQPDATPDGPQPDGLKPDAPHPDSMLPDAMPSDAAHPDGAELDAAQPDGAQPDAGQPDAAAPDAELPDAVADQPAGDQAVLPDALAELDLEAAEVAADADVAQDAPDACPKSACGLSCNDPAVCADCGNGVCEAGESGPTCAFDCCDPALCDGTPGPGYPAGAAACAGGAPDGTQCSDGLAENGQETCQAGKCVFENPHCHCAAPEEQPPVPDPGPDPQEPALPVPAELPAWQGAQPAEESFEDAWGLSAINLSAAWQVTQGDPSVLVAVVDSGCAAEAPDLAGQVVGQWDVVEQDDVAQDDSGHGTVLATIVAGNADGAGVVGVAPGVKLLCVRVAAEDGGALYEDLAAGITWAVDQGAQVVLTGHGGFGVGEGLAALKDAVLLAETAGVVVVAPAGSGGGANLDLFPAAWSPQVVSVAAASVGALPSSDTDISPTTWLLAPGEMIMGSGPDGELVSENGSSVAAALAAGAAALVRSADPELDAAAVRGILHSSGGAVPLAEFSRLFAARNLDVGAAVMAADAGGVDVALAALELVPAAPLPGQAAVLRVRVENRGALAAADVPVTVSVEGAAVALPGEPGLTELGLATGPLAAGDQAELVLDFTAGTGPFVVTATADAADDPVAGNDELQSSGIPAGVVLHRVRVRHAELSPPEPGQSAVHVSALIENAGNVGEPARTVSLVVWPEGQGPDLPVPALGPGQSVAVETTLDVAATADGRHQVDVEVVPAAGQKDPSQTYAVLRFVLDAAGDFAQKAYMQLPGENLIADAPWRSILPSIPVLLFYARTSWLQDIKPGWGKKMAWTPLLMKTVAVKNPVGPVSGKGAVAYSDWYHLPPNNPLGAEVVDEDGNKVPSADVVWTPTPADGAHRILWLPKAGLAKSCSGLPDPAVCGYFLEVTFWYSKLQVQTWVDDYTRRMLGVEDGAAKLPKFSAEDHYFDAHFHSIAEWYRGSETLGPSKAYGGPLWMVTATAASIGMLDSPDLDPAKVSGQVITTDHNTFFDDDDAPRAGPTKKEKWTAPPGTYSPEMDVYVSIFGDGASEEVTVKGSITQPIDTALGRHVLTYRSQHVNGSWGWLGAIGWAGGLCAPSYDNLIRRVACNPGAAGPCSGNGQAAQCIGGDPGDPMGFLFPAHPLTGGFQWDDAAIREALSLKSAPWSLLTTDKNTRDYLTAKYNPADSGDFVVRGYQLWNGRVAQQVKSGWFTASLRDINPYPGAVMDLPKLKWKSWTPQCDGYRNETQTAATTLLTLARDGMNYTFKEDSKPRLQFIRKVFHVAGSDAHGDFGYGTGICATQAVGVTTKLGMSEVADSAYGRPGSYVFGGTVEDLKHGRSTATDGPILELLIDPESRGSYDQAAGAITAWHDKEDKFEDADGRMGGEGFRDGGRTALVPVLYSDKGSQRVMARLRCLNISELGGGNVVKAELWVSGQGSTSEDPKLINLEGFSCNGNPQDYVIPIGFTKDDPAALLSQPVAVMAHVQIGSSCPGTYDAWTNPVWLAPMNGVIPVQAVKTQFNSLYLKMEQELSSAFSIDVVFRMTMASQKVQARIMQVDAKTGNLLEMTGGDDGKGGLILQGGLDQGWGSSPKGEDPGDTLRNRLSLRIPYNKYIYGPLTADKIEDERFVLVVSRLPAAGDAEPCKDARLCDAFGNPLGMVMLRFKPMSTCAQKNCSSDFKWCKSLCQCTLAWDCPPGSMYTGDCECCLYIDPWWLMCGYCVAKEDVSWEYCPNG